MSRPEDYRNRIISISYGIGGFFQGHSEDTIRKKTDCAIVEGRESSPFGPGFEPLEISLEVWYEMLDKLYRDVRIHEWKKRYVNPDILDGTQWSINIELSDGQTISYYGSNEYPPRWEEFGKVFREACSGRKMRPLLEP